MKADRVYDPLYGTIRFSEREAALLFAPEVQRLRYIRMCNINSLLISGASEISRFEHTIGVLHLAKEWTSDLGIKGRDADVLHAAAILHDVQTGPFGHSLEYILHDNRVQGDFRHDDLRHGAAHRYLQSVTANISYAGAPFTTINELGDLWPLVTEAIQGKGPFGPLIAGTIDFDNIDNVVRLAYHVGVADRSDALVGVELVKNMRVDDGRLSISRNSIEFLRRWQEIRRSLYRLLLHDWAEFSAKAMLTAMIELAVDQGILGSDSWRLTDDELIATLTKQSVGEGQFIGELGRRLTLGDLYLPLALWRSASVAQYSQISAAVFKRTAEKKLSEILRSRCIFHVILDRGKTERKIELLIREDGHLREFGSDTKEILIGIFVSRADFANSAKLRAINALRLMLSREGIPDLVELEDPLAAAESDEAPQQLALL